MTQMKAALLLVALSVLAMPAAGQETMRRQLTQADYDIWNSIQGSTLSNDGEWVAYTVQPLVGEGELVVRATGSTREHRHSRGYTGREVIGVGGGPGEEGGGGGGGSVGPAQFTADSRRVLFIVQPSREEVSAAEAAGRRGTAAPRPALMILDLATGSTTRVAGVRSFTLSGESGRFVAYTAPADTAAADSARSGGAARQAGAAGDAGPQRRRTYGSTLILRDLETGTETRVDDVAAHTFNRAGTTLAYVVSSRTPDRDGVYFLDLSTAVTTTVMSGRGVYRLLTWDRDGTQVAFVSDREDYDADEPRSTLYHATLRAPAARAIVAPDGAGDGLTVADRGSISFTRDGSALTFPMAPPPVRAIPADSLRGLAVFDLWHWRDPYLQSQQENSATRDRNRTFTGIYHLASRRVVQLTSDSIPSVSLSDDGRIGVANTNVPYRVEAMWGGSATDTYLVDATTGEMTTLRTAARGNASLSPGARYVTWFEDGGWHAYSVRTRRTVALTEGLDVRFDRETHSTPSTPPAWGIAGWTPDDASVLVYDRYDIWELDPAGARAPRMVTDSAGRRSNTVFRLVNLDRDSPFVDPAQPLLLRAVDETTMASGFWQDRLGRTTPPEQIMMAHRNVGTPQRARDAERYVLTMSTFQEFPNLWTGTRLDQLSRISDANPQQAEYRWGTVEIVSWLTNDGVPVRGLLYKPEDFDPSQKYPMVVYFYDTHTPSLHSYSTPTGRNVINAPVYVSRGYLVFMPDIHYVDGYPGPSALKTIVPGVQHLIAQGFVKEDGIGIQGQSWGGYQTTYIITQSNLFAAAMAGAPVANMTSAYGGIRYESGNSRTSQYEFGQSRIGGSPWQYPTRYIENSPLFYADRVETPLLIMHNDNDGAVPWTQGIEMFIALRRLGKEVYLLNYNGDAHNPRRRANQRDMDLRMQQFFDHHLTGAPAPDWMTQGIPFLRKGSDQVIQTEPAESTATAGNGG
ncbi:MAG TPA: prolyl oligopeptidase family serine peptidase [Longimicrobiales bacterium]|nr:prolyl oligopeptidase family serine peptidase [Longimicrobiales bacterium]